MTDQSFEQIVTDKSAPYIKEYMELGLKLGFKFRDALHNTSERRVDLISVNTEMVITGDAVKNLVTLEPSPYLLGLLAAFRALDGNSGGNTVQIGRVTICTHAYPLDEKVKNEN